jgi:hypothetical protein
MSLTITDDWSGVVAVLKDEFGEGGQARSMENSIIRTSLKSIKGSQQEEAMQLFYTFALVPEDTFCPLEILGYLFCATGLVRGGNKKQLKVIPPRLLVRKWLKVLIDRSLVLGTVDRPQLHDIVLEFVSGQFTPATLQGSHRELIRILQKSRPPGGWNRLNSTVLLGFWDRNLHSFRKYSLSYRSWTTMNSTTTLKVSPISLRTM